MCWGQALAEEVGDPESERAAGVVVLDLENRSHCLREAQRHQGEVRAAGKRTSGRTFPNHSRIEPVTSRADYLTPTSPEVELSAP